MSQRGYCANSKDLGILRRNILIKRKCDCLELVYPEVLPRQGDPSGMENGAIWNEELWNVSEDVINHLFNLACD